MFYANNLYNLETKIFSIVQILPAFAFRKLTASSSVATPSNP